MKKLKKKEKKTLNLDIFLLKFKSIIFHLKIYSDNNELMER